ncbi:MAG: HD domain-containing protein [Bacilli bacterium]|jgi:uncharacterized protein
MSKEKNIINEARKLVFRQLQDEPSGHDYEHVARVVFMAKKLATHYPLSKQQKFILELSAWLHDLDDRKLEKKTDDLTVPNFLCEHFLDKKIINEILEIIKNISYQASLSGAKQTTIVGKIVQDADRLDALGVIGVARAFAYGGSKKRPMRESLAHFEEKLLKLLPLFNLPETAEIAQKRHRDLQEFYRKYNEENQYEEYDLLDEN